MWPRVQSTHTCMPNARHNPTGGTRLVHEMHLLSPSFARLSSVRQIWARSILIDGNRAAAVTVLLQDNNVCSSFSGQRRILRNNIDIPIVLLRDNIWGQSMTTSYSTCEETYLLPSERHATCFNFNEKFIFCIRLHRLAHCHLTKSQVLSSSYSTT